MACNGTSTVTDPHLEYMPLTALLITVGSRGDWEPFASLAVELDKKKHRVLCFCQEDAQSTFVAGERHVMPFTQNDFYKFLPNPTGVQEGDSPRTRFVAVKSDIIAELVLPNGQDVLKAAERENVNVIITSALARPLALAVGTKLGIPVCVICLQPTVPTGLFPHHSNIEDCAIAMSQALSTTQQDLSQEWKEEYLTLEQKEFEFLRKRLDKFCDEIDLPNNTLDNVHNMITGNDDKVELCNCFPLHDLVPTCPDGGEHIHNVGPLADTYIPPDFEAPQDLVDFLSTGSSPVCIGYGSMPLVGHVESMSRKVLTALMATWTRAVIVGGAAGIGPEHLSDSDNDKDLFEWAQGNVLCIQSVPYPWLLPQCSAMLCHGGAGVVNASLRAGTPLVISPFFGDQFTWARAVEKRGIGVFAGPNLTEVSTETLIASINKAKEETVQTKCLKVREAIFKRPAGVDKMVDLLERICSK